MGRAGRGYRIAWRVLAPALIAGIVLLDLVALALWLAGD